jgi:hypothetical protein
MNFHIALAQRVVRTVEAADLSLTEEGHEISLEAAQVHDQLGIERAALALA